MLCRLGKRGTTVCISLSIFYAMGLTLVGLPSGLLIGIAAGMLSFIRTLGRPWDSCFRWVLLFAVRRLAAIVAVAFIFFTACAGRKHPYTEAGGRPHRVASRDLVIFAVHRRRALWFSGRAPGTAGGGGGGGAGALCPAAVSAI